MHRARKKTSNVIQARSCRIGWAVPGAALALKAVRWLRDWGDGFRAKLNCILRPEAVADDAHEREEFLDSLVENIPDMIFVKDASQLRFLRFNQAGESLLGYSRAELIGKNDYDFFPTEEADFFTREDRRVLAQGEIVEIPEEPIRTRLQGERILHTKKVPIYDRKGNPKYLLGISEDITDWKNAKAERDKISQEVMRLKIEREVRSTFVSTLSHDLRTPLTAAKTCAELLLRFPEREGLRKALPGEIVKSLERADKMIRDLLDASRIQAGQLLSLTLEALDLPSFLQELLQQQSLIYGGRLVLEIKGHPSGYWSHEGLRRVLENLISNAIKYGASGGPVIIRACSEGGRALISVHNEGNALMPDEIKKLFQPYIRASDSAGAREKGWGLGLTIVQGLVAAQGGVIRVESSPGAGTTFTVDLPKDARSRPTQGVAC
jgi:PAS domain S-box-containing protein